jgi:hypothetical protein
MPPYNFPPDAFRVRLSDHDPPERIPPDVLIRVVTRDGGRCLIRRGDCDHLPMRAEAMKCLLLEPLRSEPRVIPGGLYHRRSDGMWLVTIRVSDPAPYALEVDPELVERTLGISEEGSKSSTKTRLGDRELRLLSVFEHAGHRLHKKEVAKKAGELDAKGRVKRAAETSFKTLKEEGYITWEKGKGFCTRTSKPDP